MQHCDHMDFVGKTEIRNYVVLLLLPILCIKTSLEYTRTSVEVHSGWCRHIHVQAKNMYRIKTDDKMI